MKELTHIEKEIIQLLADGLTLKEMVPLLHNCENTLETYRYRLFKKMGARNAPHCIALAFRNKVLN